VMSETSTRKIWEILEKEIYGEVHRDSIASEEEALPLPAEKRTLH